MSERKRWRVVLLLAGAALGLAGFSTAAAGAEDGSSRGENGPAWKPVLIGMEDANAPDARRDDLVLGLIVSSAGPGLGYAVSSRVSLAVGYDYVTEETLGLEVLETGALNTAYASHEVMVRALWQF